MILALRRPIVAYTALAAISLKSALADGAATLWLFGLRHYTSTGSRTA